MNNRYFQCLYFIIFQDDNGAHYPNHQQSSQLQVLYEARGRKIESLQIELEEKEENYSKELRILNHKLVLATGVYIITCVEVTCDNVIVANRFIHQSKSF